MKKNVLRKDFFMEIRKSMGRFVSIFFIVALGVAFYSGIRASDPSMRVSGDAYFDKENLMDIKVMGTLGLTEDDIRAIGSVDGIEAVEGAHSKDVLCPVGETEKVVHLMSAQKEFNTVQVKEGRMPEKAGECLLDEDFVSTWADYKIGDRITFRSGEEEPLTDSLTTDTFTVVGIGNSPLYISFGRGNSMIGNGEISGFVVTDESSFDMDVYTEAYARVSGAIEATAFSAEYEELSEAAVDALKEIKEERCRIRRQDIIDEADAEVADAQKTVDEESGKLADAKQELEDARSKAAAELEKARKKLEDGEEQLRVSRAQIADGEAQIASAKTELTGRQKQLTAAKKEYESGLSELNRRAKELEDGEQLYLSNYAAYMPLITQGKEQIAEGREQIADGRVQIETGLEQIEAGLDPLTQLQAGLTQIRAGMEKIQEERGKLEAQLENGQALYEAYSQIPAQERTAEQEAYLAGWDEAKAQLTAGITQLNMQEAGLTEQKNGMLLQMQAAGLESEEALAAQIDALTLQKNALGQKKQELEEAEENLNEREQILLAQESQLMETGRQIQEGKKELAAGRGQLEQAKAQIDSGQAQINAAWGLLGEKETALISGRTELAAGEKELAEGRGEYEQAAADAAKQIAEGEEKIADGEEKLADARREIADARAEIDKIENPKWYVQDRSEALTEYDGYGENADRMRSLGHVFPVLFFLVAALISLTTMTRMVEEQRVQIGTLKALGYSKFAIAKKYVFYALLATMGGSIVGVLIGEKILPFIIIYAYKIMYKHIPDILLPYHVGYAVQATVIAVLCTLLATVYSCYHALASEPAQLMRPPAPKQGKRIFLERIGWFWKRLSFTWKSSVRNMIRYKKRFFMTVFGIGGCMALMLVGFGLKDCIYEIVTLQYEKIQFYDAAAYLDDTITSEEREEILNYMGDNSRIDDYMQLRMQKVKVKSDKSEESLYLSVPEDNQHIENFLSFHSRTKDEVYSLSKDEVIMSEKIADTLGVNVGDTVTIEDEEKGDAEVTIGAICENYMSHYLYLPAEKYEELYGVPVKFNSIIYRVKDGGDAEIEKIGIHLLGYDNVLNVTYTSSIEGRLDDMLKSLNLVIVVLIISAGMLAFVVLYNLNNINITERKRELATLKVLGFYDGEVGSYVFRENIMLTVLGSLAGMMIGNVLLKFTVVTVEVEEAMFGREIHGPSYLYSFLFTIGFSLFVNWVMYFKLKKIDMVESLKSVE